MLFIAGFSPQSHAHVFAAPYTLPVPFWLYAYGSTVALLISFVAFALFSSPRLSGELIRAHAHVGRTGRACYIIRPAWAVVFQCLGGLVLAINMIGGFVGSPNPMLNFNMTWFWIVFLLLSLYGAAIIGDFYQVFSPWRNLFTLLDKSKAMKYAGYVRYPAQLDYFPALLFYFLLVSIELFGDGSPATLGFFLLAYCCWMVVGSCIFGADAWTRHADVFGVMFYLVGMLAPVAWVFDGKDWRIQLRMPFSGIRSASEASLSLTCFIVFMLSSTAFDGIHDTVLWNSTYWSRIFPLVRTVVDSYSNDVNSSAAYVYYLWQRLCLALSPVVYLAAYGAVLACGKVLVGSRRSNKQLIADFAWSLLPVAFFYNVAHYFTVALSQSPQIIKLASDPLGQQWDLFGTATLTAPSFVIDAGVVWNVQVTLVLVGHVLGVYFAHAQSLSSFDTRAKAVFSQVPMMMLMVTLTASGLWILSLPMNSA